MPAHAQRMSSLLVADKASAACRVERGAQDGGRGAGPGSGTAAAARKHARGERVCLTEGWGARAREERTRNMSLMVVTLDVSKLSGWLNADARCRVERGAYGV